MVTASVLDEDWLPEVEQSPGPYFFVAEDVLVYLPEDQVTAALARIARRFPGAQVALDTYPRRSFEHQYRMAARKDMRAQLAARYRYLVPLADPLVGKMMILTLFRASSPAAAGQAGTARAAGAA